MTDFDRIFEPGYSAVDLFTDRRAEHESFGRALAGHAERVLAGEATLASTARRNVLTYYGIGGIGKTELSRRLERWVLGDIDPPGEWGPPPRFDQEVRTVRVDFHGSGAVDAAGIVMKLRAAAAGSGRRLAAFDLGFAAWWALAHPGTALPQVHSATGTDVRAQITDTLNDILSDAGARFGLGPLTVRMGIRIVDAIRSRRLRSETLRECAPLAAVIDQARRDASPYVAATLAGLLSWDLAQLRPGQAPLVIAFADAAEYIQADDRSQERLLNRIVHLTPQVLWVITSRNSLDWDSRDLAGRFAAVGPHVWPGLCLDAAGEPRQHLVGDLSRTDMLRYLRAASGSAGNPELGEDVIERICDGAHGLPLYLDLSLALAREAHAAGGPLDPAVFGGSLPELVTQVFADLPRAERDVARAASLLPRFEPGLVAQAAGALLGDALRLCRRSLVSRDGHPLFPFRLHDAVRSAIAEEPVTSQGAWAATDRAACAAQLVEVLRGRHDEMAGIEDRREVLELAAGLCAAHDLRALWLRRALTDLPGLALTAAKMPPPAAGTWIGQLSAFFQGWQGRKLQERIEYLSQFITTPLDPDIDALARRWLAFGLRDVQGKAGQALAILQDLLAQDPDSGLLRYQVARTLRVLGRYGELEEHLRRYPLGNAEAAARIRSDLAYDRGDIIEAIAGAAARGRYLRSIGNHRVALENQTAALWRAALAGQATVADCDAVISEADRYGLSSIMRTSLAARIVCLRGDDDAARGCFGEAAGIISASAGKPGWREWAAAIIHDLYTGGGDRIGEARRQWDGPGAWTPNRQLVDRLFTFAGYPASYPPLAIGDASPVQIDERWHGVIAALILRAAA